MAQTTLKYRQIAGGLDGWIPAEQTWTYASATTITVPSGAASRYQKGDKIKLTQTTVKYFYVVGVADTVLTVTGGTDYTVANAAITDNYFSKILNPQGFPQRFAYTPTITAGSGTFTTVSASGEFTLTGKTVCVAVTITITTKGTASGAVIFTIPINISSSSFIFAGRENAATGKMLQCLYNAADKLSIFDYTGTAMIVDGYVLRASGTYLIA